MTSNSSRTTSVKVGYFPNVDCKRFCGFSELPKKSNWQAVLMKFHVLVFFKEDFRMPFDNYHTLYY